MESTVHFIFQLVKITILSCLYAVSVLFIFKFIAKNKPGSWFERTTKEKSHFLKNTISVFWVALLVFSFTYYGNHGLGDFARIPIGYGKEVNSTDWSEYAVVDNDNTNGEGNIETTRFAVKDYVLVGNLDSEFYSYKNSYFYYDLKSDVIKEFSNKSDFDAFANKQNLPNSLQLASFEGNYSMYWHGWRFWLFP